MRAASRDYVQPMDMQPASSAAMTSRLVVMMTPRDKKAIEARARALDMTTSELVRRAAASYDEHITPEEERMLEALTDEFVAVVADIREDLRRANERSEAHFAEMAAIRAAPKPVIDLSDEQLAALHRIFSAADELPG